MTCNPSTKLFPSPVPVTSCHILRQNCLWFDMCNWKHSLFFVDALRSSCIMEMVCFINYGDFEKLQENKPCVSLGGR